MEKLLVATRNKGKMREFHQLLTGLPYKLVSLDDVGITDTVEETGDTFQKNAILKASAYSALSGLLTLADDSGIEVDALGGRPGVYSARYGGLEASDEDRVNLLLQELKDVPWELRTARFRCVIALAWPDGRVKTVEGIVSGIIHFRPSGANGFGYDPVFYLPEKGHTTAELPTDIKNQLSHRGQAARKAAALLVESHKALKASTLSRMLTSPSTTTLYDKFRRPLRDLRVSVTDRCNFRCPYCMPAEVYGERYQFLPKSEILTFEEITRLVRVFVGLGVTKVRLTGGEPLVRQGVDKLVGMLSRLDGVNDLTLTTNGYLLTQQAQALKDAGLRRITVSLDSLDLEVFKRMNGRGYGHERVLEGIRKAEEVGLWPIKVNAVVQRGVNDHTIVDLARHFKGTGHIVRYIEYMDVGNINHWKSAEVVPAAEIVERINAVFPIEPADRSYRGEVAERWRYKDGSGEIGVIASVTKPFCGGCTRARLSTDGKLFTCLFAGVGKDLRDPMRNGASDEELRDIITGTWQKRVDKYSEERFASATRPRRKIEMYQIGG